MPYICSKVVYIPNNIETNTIVYTVIGKIPYNEVNMYGERDKMTTRYMWRRDRQRVVFN